MIALKIRTATPRELLGLVCTMRFDVENMLRRIEADCPKPNCSDDELAAWVRDINVAREAFFEVRVVASRTPIDEQLPWQGGEI